MGVGVAKDADLESEVEIDKLHLIGAVGCASDAASHTSER